MSLSSALQIATSGLRANSVQSDLTARNIANASTEGYTRKEAELITRSGGVAVQGVSREVDSLLDRLDRSNISAVARSETQASALKSYTDMLGQPDDETSPAAGLTALYTALVTLSGTSQDNAAQLGVLEMAQQLSSQISNLAQTAQDLNREVELNIRYDVSDLNGRLEEVSKINMRLVQVGGNTVEAAELQDDLSRHLDQIAAYMDIQIDTYADGAVNIYTAGGTQLVRGKSVATISYDPIAGQLFADTTEITPNDPTIRGFSAGSLAGLFSLSKDSIPQIRGQLDEMAQMLIDRFTEADPSLAAGEPGLFVDSGLLVGGLGGAGVAQRLAVNPNLLPTNGGNPSGLVTGLGSQNNFESGSITLIQNMMSAIDLRPQGQTLLGENKSLQDYAGALVAGQQQLRIAAEREHQSNQISAATISASRQNLQGVNIDDELQKLMVIEQSYAANAKMLTSVQVMLDSLLDAV